ncbi:hypothetical protein NSA24_10500 [Clostridioides mangenotii]|uniref:hypothetical protein n=1 Tax=Metaclostridioides mangenotii TaxID=1540 RepID=UPI00214A65F3|nr:hypothetical protein [Clostridioides mangenotii]MCR1955222.1 hypothetical protein [Clostridioides mangenotii]
MIKFSLSTEQFDKLQERLEQSTKSLETDINNFLHTEGAQSTVKSITGFTAVSDRNKKHAKMSNPYSVDTINLGFTIRTKNSFRYLVFPDGGIGAHNPIAQQFFKKGLESESNRIFERLIKILDEKLKLQ